jgi:hypothetical protein
MVSGGDISTGLSGTLAMARGKGDWEERLDMSTRAVFVSFWAMPLSLPAIILSNELVRRVQLTSDAPPFVAMPGPVLGAVVAVAAALLAWSASLFVLARLAHRTGAGWRVSPLLIGYNWSRLIVHLVSGLGAVLVVLTGQPFLQGPLALGAVVLAIWLDYGVVRRALAIGLGPTLGILLMLFLARALAVIVTALFTTPFLEG